MYDVSKLEKLSEKLYANVEGWENGALQRIGKRVNEIGRLSIADAQALNNMAVVKGDLKVIYRELAEVTGKNIAEIEKIYSDVINEIHNDNKLLYDYRKKPFIPFEENERLHAMVRAYAKATATDMINLSKTKMLRTFDPTSKKTVSVDKAYKALIDKAVVEVSSGASDFHSSMRSCLKTLGGNGIRVDYGGGVTRRLDTVVRQNLLWGAKQTFMGYSDIIGEEIGADGIEIDAHPFCRPSHEFMQGQQYILGKGRMIDGEYFESADNALAALQDYGCKHFKFAIICGVSVPAHSKKELAKMHRKNKEKINIDGVEKTGYEWKQSMRQLETKTRQLKGEREMLRAAGDKEGVRQVDAKINAIKDKYTKIGEKSGNELRYNRMSIVRQNNGLTKGGSGGIIKPVKTNSEVQDVHYIGKIDRNIYKCVTEDIKTDEVIITDTQIQHIKDRHPNDYEKYFKYAEEIIKHPNYIIEANKPYTALILKEIETENEKFKTILRLSTSIDSPKYKNSIITFMKIDDKEWKRIIKNKKTLYKSE